MSKKLSALLAGLVVLSVSANAAELNAYTIMPEKYASQIFAQFTKDTGIKVNFLRFSTGEALARLTAEKGNPQVDVLLGGPADMYAAGIKEGIWELIARPTPMLFPRPTAIPITTGPVSV